MSAQTHAARVLNNGDYSDIEPNPFADEPAVIHAANIVTLDAVQPETVSWLWPGRIPLGKLTVFDGDPGLGKSLASLDIAARVSAGKPMPDGTRGALSDSATVVLVSVEDGLADTIRPRADLAGADPRRIVAITSIPGADGNDRPVVVPDDWPRIEAVVTEHDARLVVLDPLMALLGADVNSYRDQDARRALLPGVQMAERTGAALVVIRHLNKGAGSSAIYRGGGSIGIAGAARSVLLVAKDPDDDTEERRIVASVKSNLSAPAPALAYRIESGANGHPYLVWEGATEHTANQLLAMLSDDRGERRDALEEAADYLRDALAGGPRPTRDVLRDARAHGISEAAIRRARKTLGITAQKSGFGGDGPWCLTMPDHPKAFTETQRRSPQNVNAFGEVERLCESSQRFCSVCDRLLGNPEDRERGVHLRCLDGGAA